MAKIKQTKVPIPHLQQVNALDPDLPMLAARAAVQVDRLIGALRRHEPIRTLRVDAIKELGEMVSGVSNAIASETGSRALVHPLTANLFSQAYSDASHAQLSSWNDLQRAAKELSLLFQRASKGNDNLLESLDLVRDFCVKLSEYAASKRQLAYGDRPVPAHWR